MGLANDFPSGASGTPFPDTPVDPASPGSTLISLTNEVTGILPLGNLPTLLGTRKAKITLAGATTILSDLTTLGSDGDWALAVGTGNQGYLVARIGTRKYSVTLTEVVS